MSSDSLKRFAKNIYSDDLALDKRYGRGDAGQKVILIQEWLCLHDIHVVIDGIFGPATQKAVRIFQKRKELREEGIVENITFRELIKPMTDALSFEPSGRLSLGDAVVECAKAHLTQRPREIGGPNMGPWVRLYLDGWQGVPWCAGFASFVIKQAAFSIDEMPPFKTSFSCDLLAKSARLKNLLLIQPSRAERSKLKPGSLFLNRKSESDWNHTGIVAGLEDEVFYSIEGNSPAEAGEVCERIRGFDNKDFILI
jgi:hypothetical protein